MIERELLAVHEHLADSEVVELGDLRVYPQEFLATLGGERLPLTNKEFRLLVLFVRNPGKLLPRRVIANEVWGTPDPGRTIDIHIARLRNRLPDGSIETVIRVGYRFILEV